ncbi:hypothetical protein HN51_002273 [Arachis hypogaea]|uniref:Phytocyanin domain-containing protein n=2 Tax=Arachis TaxID=3817 RepID=A0A445EN06_ARAHY|nr:early nodulin-16 [Arachis duranensis]XP_025607546.1 early nodulin-16 [Arachis hypogaea]QHO50463.1 uncharacterized protein DS421_1g22710 [Arachis hypogaea]RYR76849.1 hypothetical protein Ahy_A01g001376 [Arachis hypogaea]
MASIQNVSPFPLFFLIIMMSTTLLLLISNSEGREFLVGGSEDSWKVPLPSPDFLNQWAGTHRFKIGDALIFKYDNMTESVQMVPEEDYESCERVGDDHQRFNDGNTKVILRSSGPIHFISGQESHCHMGLKLAVVVMSAIHHHQPTSPNHSLPLPPSPSPAAPLSTNQGALAHTPPAGFIMGFEVSSVMLFFLVI